MIEIQTDMDTLRQYSQSSLPIARHHFVEPIPQLRSVQEVSARDGGDLRSSRLPLGGLDLFHCALLVPRGHCTQCIEQISFFPGGGVTSNRSEADERTVEGRFIGATFASASIRAVQRVSSSAVTVICAAGMSSRYGPY